MPTFHADEVAPDTTQDQGKPGPWKGAYGRVPPPQTTWLDSAKTSAREVGSDIKGVAKGMADLGKYLPVEPTGNPAADAKAINEHYKAESAPPNIVTPIKKAIQGKPQEGQPPESAPVGIERPFAALDVLMGGDPGTAKTRKDEVGRISALITGPLLMHLIARGAEGPEITPAAGPKPLSAVPALRENIPPGTSPVAERTMRATAPGKYLPNDIERTKKISSAFGPSNKVEVAKDVKALLPELDKTARQWGTHPKGVVGTEGITEPYGKGVNEADTLPRLLDNTMRRLEGDYQSVLGPNRAVNVPTQSIADEIDKHITTGMANFAASNPESEVANTLKYLQETKKLFENKELTLQDVDDLRKYYYNATKAGEAGRVAQRSNEAVMADSAIEQGLRNLIYDRLEGIAKQQGKPPGFIRDLKSNQARIYGLSDLATPNATQLMNQDAITRGYSLLQRANVTSAIHPESMTPVFSVHGLVKGFAGEPKSLPSMEKRVTRAFGEQGVPNTKLGKAATNAVSAAKSAGKQTAIGSIPERQGQQKKDATAPPPVTVKMRAPDGSTKAVPMSEVQHYKSKGAVVVQ